MNGQQGWRDSQWNLIHRELTGQNIPRRKIDGQPTKTLLSWYHQNKPRMDDWETEDGHPNKSHNLLSQSVARLESVLEPGPVTEEVDGKDPATLWQLYLEMTLPGLPKGNHGHLLGKLCTAGYKA